MRRGRRHPEHLRVGDTLDFWRVEAVEPGRLLRLRAEMKLPGRAWLQFEIDPADPASSRLRQTAIFDPVGLAGIAYWYILFPLHAFVFRSLLRGLREASEKPSTQSFEPPPAIQQRRVHWLLGAAAVASAASVFVLRRWAAD